MHGEQDLLFCFGLGYSAQALARNWQAGGGTGLGGRAAGTVRSAEKAEALTERGLPALVFDGMTAMAEAERWLSNCRYLLISIPPGDDSERVLHFHRSLLAANEGLQWVGYLSTTGVYGDRQGAWVTEDSALEPTGSRGRRRMQAEREWLRWGDDAGKCVQVFRLAGIYGPGRNALVSLRQGRARRIVKPGQVFSRIHVEDIVQILRASMLRPRPGGIYNVCDDAACPPQDVIAYAAGLLGLPVPPDIAFADADLSPMAASFYADNKRVANQRIKQQLGVRLRYPDYRAGLQALAADLLKPAAKA